MQQDWQRIRFLFDSAVDLPRAERAAYLDTACDDDVVRAEVEALLSAADEPGALDALGARLSSVRDVLADTPPERAGPYIIDAPIGHGGMGVVYRAHDPRLARAVALKFMPLSIPSGSADAERLLAEARTASALDHPNICTIYDIGHLEDDRVFIAMAYYPRGTLEDRLRAGPLPVRDAIAIARQIAAALDCAHAAGVVHRDIKPANVAFGERDEVKVLDFGVAVLEHDVAGGTGTAGTPSYMSPEQARGAAVEARSDVWSVGVLLYEMLTGRRPFTGSTRAEILECIASREPDDVARLRDDVPPALAAVVRRTLAKDPALRYASAADLRIALERVHAAPVAFARRRRYVAAAGVVLLLSAMGALALYDRPVHEPGMSGDSLLDDQVRRARQRYYEGTPESVEAAARILANVTSRDSTHALGRAYLAITYAASTAPSYSRQLETQWHDSALVHARAAIRLAPDLPDGYAALGVTYRWMGRHDDALAEHRKALARDPDFALSVQEAGGLHMYRRERPQALEYLERGVRLDPNARATRRHLVSIYRTYGLYPDALRHIHAGLEVAPDDASMHWEAVMVRLETGDTVAARSHFETYLQLQPPGERDRMHAWFEILRGERRAAAEFIDRLDLERAPWYDLRTFGTTYLRLGRRAEGNALLRRALVRLDEERRAPDWPRGGGIFQIGIIHAALDEPERAIAALQEWLDLGGAASWERMGLEREIAALNHDPRFREIVRISEERYIEQRAVVEGELRRFRDR